MKHSHVQRGISHILLSGRRRLCRTGNISSDRYFDKNPYIIPPSISGNPVRIIREDLNGGQTFNYSDSIRNQINRGTSTVNFMGHAGSQDWEIGMRDPDVLTNYDGKFPLIFSMTCYTGKKLVNLLHGHSVKNS
ncbi:MAG: C25 family cysteine peptidase [Ignavibacteria bacterium]